jgi:hypothetical protein
MKPTVLALLALVFLSLDASAQATRHNQKVPAPIYGSVERTKLLSQNRGKPGDVLQTGSVERRAALSGKKVQVLRKPARHTRHYRR